MRNFCLVLAFFLLAPSLIKAQGIEQFKSKLQRPDQRYNSTVQITEHGDARTVIQTLGSGRSRGKVLGYRVRIFFDNSQNAREKANGAIGRFKEIYPDIPAYRSYEAPYFKVTVGNCLTSEEVIILWGKIRESFNVAFPIREEIDISLFGESQLRAVSETTIDDPETDF